LNGFTITLLLFRILRLLHRDRDSDRGRGVVNGNMISSQTLILKARGDGIGGARGRSWLFCLCIVRG
jgi:hypothetical protein